MLRGSLDDFTLPDILRLLSSAKKTGVLAVSSRGGRGRVYFRGGDVYYAEENGDPRSVGQRLVDSGVVTGDEVDDALALSERTGRSVGEILISDTGTTLDRLQQAVIDQINDACFDLMRWGQGDFIWQHGQGIRPEVDASISVDEIIIEAARRLDAIANQEPQSLPEAAVPALSPAFASAAAPITISPDQWRILAFLDGRRTAAEVAALAGGDTADALRDLHHLTSAGVVELVESSPKVRPPSPPVVPQAPTDAAPHDAAPREAAPSDPNPAPREEPPLPVHSPLQVVPQEAVEALEEEAPPEPAPPLKEDFAAFQEVAIASAHESVGDGAETATPPPSPPVEDFDAPGHGEMTTRIPEDEPTPSQSAPPPPPPPPASMETPRRRASDPSDVVKALAGLRIDDEASRRLTRAATPEPAGDDDEPLPEVDPALIARLIQGVKDL